MKTERGCVYFFRHIGLSPIKIGYSENESPINRFNSFKTYAPYGSEILGFIIISDAKEIESHLHKKYANKRLQGEWFDLSEEDVKKEIDFFTNVSDIKERNDFQIAWAKEIEKRNNKITEEIEISKNLSKKELFFKLYKNNKQINKTQTANEFGVSRRCIHDWIKMFDKL